jgi:Glyoxalase-like domain
VPPATWPEAWQLRAIFITQTRAAADHNAATMYTKIQVVFDAADPARLAEFWAQALGYVTEPPPPGFATWEDFARSIGMPEEEWGDQASVVDPEGLGPRIYIQRVPEPKTTKNRVHLDIRVAGRCVNDAPRRLPATMHTSMRVAPASRESSHKGYGVVGCGARGTEDGPGRTSAMC